MARTLFRAIFLCITKTAPTMVGAVFRFIEYRENAVARFAGLVNL